MAEAFDLVIGADKNFSIWLCSFLFVGLKPTTVPMNTGCVKQAYYQGKGGRNQQPKPLCANDK